MLLDYAERHGFDPFVIDNWDKVQIDHFLSAKVIIYGKHVKIKYNSIKIYSFKTVKLGVYF